MTLVQDELVQDIGKLSEGTDFAATLFECLVGYAIIAADFDGGVIAYNEGARQIYGYDPEEILGKKNIEVFFPRDFIEGGRFQELIEVLLTTGRYTCEGEKVRKGGSRFPAQILLTLTKDKAGKVVGFVEIVQELTDRKAADEVLRNHRDQLAKANEKLHAEILERARTELELQRAKEAAEAANRSKTEFLANMSHEIRTPMNGILGMTEMVMDTPLSPTQREYLGIVKSSADSLMMVINDILDFSKIEAGKLDLEMLPFFLSDCLEDTIRVLAPRAHAKGLELILRIDPDVPEAVVGDPGRLRQVLINLIGNACKFTHRGEIVVAVEVGRPADVDNSVVLQFAVSDTGVGIRREAVNRIFDPFVQADGSTTRKYGGTGLGLTISRTLVALMGGTVWVETEEGRGSTFRFSARFERQSQPGPAWTALRAGRLRGLRILIVDDNPTSRRVVEEMLLSWEARPKAVDGGPAALAAVREASSRSDPFVLLLIDASMPGMDGFALVERLGDNSSLCGNVVMMLTSHSLPSDIARCEQLGVAAHLTKPIRQRELFETLLTVSGNASVRQKPPSPRIGGPAQASNGETKRLKILVIDDNVFNVKVASVMLEKMGHTVNVAFDGKAARTKLSHQPFDLVLMDLQMPAMDGLEATAAIRSSEAGTARHVPIVALTAYATKEDRDRCLEAGMDGYVSKPIQQDKLRQAIEDCVYLIPETVPARPLDV
jgi:PAS domain S-box-containing protein